MFHVSECTARRALKKYEPLQKAAVGQDFIVNLALRGRFRAISPQVCQALGLPTGTRTVTARIPLGIVVDLFATGTTAEALSSAVIGERVTLRLRRAFGIKESWTCGGLTAEINDAGYLLAGVMVVGIL